MRARAISCNAHGMAHVGGVYREPLLAGLSRMRAPPFHVVITRPHWGCCVRWPSRVWQRQSMPSGLCTTTVGVCRRTMLRR